MRLNRSYAAHQEAHVSAIVCKALGNCVTVSARHLAALAHVLSVSSPAAEEALQRLAHSALVEPVCSASLLLGLLCDVSPGLQDLHDKRNLKQLPGKQTSTSYL